MRAKQQCRKNGGTDIFLDIDCHNETCYYDELYSVLSKSSKLGRDPGIVGDGQRYRK